ncbi:hypothetical protein M153_132940001, partial [Pseudoloma neurophilia]
LMAIDYFTRRVFGEKIENKSSEKILKTIQKWFKKTGMPKKITKDQGKEFTSQIFIEFYKKEKIEQITVSIEHFEANGRI